MRVVEKNKLVLSAGIMLVQSCSHLVTDQMPARPGITQLKDATYKGLDEQPIRLVAGRFEGEPFVPGGASRLRVVLHDELIIFADLDDDGVNEAIVPLVKQAGGSGTWTYLAIMGADARNIDTVLLGDRIQLIELSTRGPRVHADFIKHGPTDGMCCPTQRVEQEWILRNSRLEGSETLQIGTLSIGILAGTAWTLKSATGLERIDSTEPLTAVFGNDRIDGFAGCNRYFASIQSREPGQISLGTMGATARECEASSMSLESRFLRDLENIDHYGFSVGQLVLSGSDGDGSRIDMTFSRSTSSETP